MSIRVLIADDQAMIRGGLRLILEDQPGIEVVAEAADGTEAVRLARQLRPDVCLVDIRMPGTDGLALAEQASGARTEATALEIVLLTGHAAPEDAFSTPDGRPMQVVRKPVRLRSLVETLRRAHAAALERRRRAAAARGGSPA